MREVHYYCNLCDEECENNDCGVEVTQHTMVKDGNTQPMTSTIKWFVSNSGAHHHICKSCRKKLEAMRV